MMDWTILTSKHLTESLLWDYLCWFACTKWWRNNFIMLLVMIIVGAFTLALHTIFSNLVNAIICWYTHIYLCFTTDLSHNAPNLKHFIWCWSRWICPAALLDLSVNFISHCFWNTATHIKMNHFSFCSSHTKVTSELWWIISQKH